MKKEPVILAALLIILVAVFMSNIQGSKERRIGELTFKTGTQTLESENIKKSEGEGSLRIDKKNFPPKRASFKLGNQNIFRPLLYVTRSAPAPAITQSVPPIMVSTPNLTVFVGIDAEVPVTNAQGTLSVVFNPDGIGAASGTSSPLTFSCLVTGRTVATISDGNSSVTLNLDCDLRPPEKKLASFIFLGFLESEKEKTIFLSKDGEIFVVKRGDTLVKKSATIPQDYVVKIITDEKVVISSSDGSDLMEISLIENEPLLRNK